MQVNVEWIKERQKAGWGRTRFFKLFDAFLILSVDERLAFVKLVEELVPPNEKRGRKRKALPTNPTTIAEEAKSL